MPDTSRPACSPGATGSAGPARGGAVHRGAGLLLPLLLAASHAAADEPARVDFARDIRPILSNTCFKCHGPDEATREAGLRLDTPDGAHEDLGGYQPIVPHDPEASAVIERVTSDDPNLRMPPEDSGLALSDEQIELLRAWIAEGAAYDQHWAFRPIERPAVPTAGGWGHNPIDAFVHERLDEADLTPSPEADRATLIRRVHLDLLGLPPEPEEVDAYVGDARPGAYQRMVDRALANPHYGERWGRHWLDQARYGDTNGYSIDSERSIWPYRDWVLGAINADMPFDRFTIEQLAGDLLPEPTQDQLVATGFHRNTLVNQEGGVDAEQFRNEAVVDRTNTTGAVWLGLTVGCAQCHTHKYDPITHHEYYQLFAFFNHGEDVNSVAPTMPMTTPAQGERLAEFDREIAAARKALDAFDREKEQRLAAQQPDDAQPVEWTVVEIEDAESEAGARFETLDDGSLLASGDNGEEDRYTLAFTSPLRRITAVRVEALTHSSLPNGGPGRAGNGNFVLNEIALHAGDSAATWLHASADHSQKDYEVGKAIDGDAASGWAINVAGGRLNTDRTARFVASATPTEAKERVTLTLSFSRQPPKYNLGRFRISVTDAAHAQLDVPDAERAELAARLEQLRDAKDRYAKAIPQTMVMRERKEPRETHVLIRGDFLRTGDRVRPGVPAVLPPLPQPEGGEATRLDLAKWIVDGNNPLTARVTVNRTWMRFFGQGLVETENDFGLQGTSPTHPELLDWLASEFVQQGWSMKQLHRTILSSATYRQASHIDPDLQRADPLNKRLARQSRLRLEAEVVRDVGIAASGLLSRKLGGPSVYPPQPDGVYAFTQRKAPWPTSTGGDRYRRGVYTFFMRSAPHPMLSTFDTPRFDTTCTRRVRSNTPLQSLTMANAAPTVENARALARRLLRTEADDRRRIERAYRLCFSRAPSAAEAERLRSFFEAQRQAFVEAPEDARAVSGEGADADARATAERAAWTATARVLMNLDEFITRE